MGKNRKIKQLKKALAPTLEKMPMILRQSKERHFLSISECCDFFDKRGKEEIAEVEELFYKWQAKGFPGIPVDMPVQVAVNHSRGMKAAYLKGGIKGVNSYIQHQVDTVLKYREERKKEATQTQEA